MTDIFVPVVDQRQQPLMPTTPARARRWLKSGKATSFWKGGIFCVRLNAEPSARATQPIAVGIDPGDSVAHRVVSELCHAACRVDGCDQSV